MAEKETIMVLKVVDLQCSCCYKKIKKILCKFPQIRDQVYDEKANTVTITVVCCDPEKIRDKLCCKGGKVIKSIEIKEPPKPKEPEKPKVVVLEKPKEPVKPKEPEKPKVVVLEKPKEPVKPKEPEKPIVVVEKPKEPEKPKVIVVEKPKETEKPKEPEKPKVDAVVEKPKPIGPPPVEKPKEAPKPDPPKIPQPLPLPPPNPPVEPEPVTFHGPPPLYPVPTCCGQCYSGYDGGPCRLGFGVPPPPLPRFEGYYGYGCGHGCGYGYGRDCHHFSRCDYYLTEENPSSCSIM